MVLYCESVPGITQSSDKHVFALYVQVYPLLLYCKSNDDFRQILLLQRDIASALNTVVLVNY